MKEEILRMDRVTRIVDGVTRLDNFSLHIFRGEIVGLLSMNDQGRDDLVELLQQNLPLQRVGHHAERHPLRQGARLHIYRWKSI